MYEDCLYEDTHIPETKAAVFSSNTATDTVGVRVLPDDAAAGWWLWILGRDRMSLRND